MSDVLDEVRSTIKSALDRNLKALLLIDRYGTLFASAADPNLPRETLSKMCAVLYGSADRLGENMGQGSPRLLVVEYEAKTLCIAKSLTGKYLLIALCSNLTEEVRTKLTGISLKL